MCRRPDLKSFPGYTAQKLSSAWRVSSGNVTKSAVLVTFTEEILNGKLHFLNGVATPIYFRSSTRPSVATIIPVDEKSNHTVSLENEKDDICSLSALITVKLKSPDEDSTVILAEEEGWIFGKDHRQFSFLMLSKSKGIDKLLSPLKSSENQR